MAGAERGDAAEDVGPNQAALVAYLTDSATHGSLPVEHIETHTAHVFLAGAHAYKMKKAVALEFVDFSTLARRKAACEAELVVNARTARALYLDVVAVNRTPNGFRLGPPAAPVEYLVRMNRFDQHDLLDKIAGRHALDSQTVREFADAVADLHLSATVIPSHAVPETFDLTLRDLATNLDGALPDGERQVFAEWRRMAEAASARLLTHLAARARRGAVRRGHGDLHLRNACRYRGEVMLFDAIEFAPRFSHVDVLYDAAFAVMDLRHRGEEAAAILFLSRYLAATRDYVALPALSLFISARAAVRALVSCLTPAAGLEVGSYLTLARDALASPMPNRLIAVGGRSGTGKSRLAEALAPKLGAAPDVVILRSDEIRKCMLGRRPDTALDRSAYGSRTSAAVYRRVLRDAARALRAGASVIIDATHLEARQRADVAALARRLDVRFDGLWLVAADGTLADRLSARGTDASDATAAIMRGQPDVRTVRGWCTLSSEAGPSATLAAAEVALGCAGPA